MDTKFALLLCALVSASLGAHVSHTDDQAVDERVSRIVRADGVDGYDFAQLYSDDMETPATKRDLMDHAEEPSEDDRSFSLHLNSGDKLRMSLRKRSVVDSDTMVVELEGDKETTRRLGERDCYFSGPTEGTDGHASLSLCGGRLMGSVVTEKRHYEVHALPESSRREAEPVRVLVTWSDVSKRNADDDEDGDKDRDEYSDESEKSQMTGLLDDVIVPDDEDEEEHGRNISRRSVEDRRAVVEMSNYLDHWYLKKVKESLGLSTTDELIDLQILKWNGAQAILSDKDFITWDIKIKLVKIVIWRTDPSWYKTSTSNKLGERMSKICVGTKDRDNSDQITLSTSYVTNTGIIGVSYIKGVCTPRYRCSAVITANLKHFTELHEFGHSLGLNHDGVADMNCPKDKTNGFMGGNRFYFRNDCYRWRINWVFPNKNCLFSQKTTSQQAQLKPLLPGQTVGVKDQCKLWRGDGYEYLSVGSGSTMCARFGCMNTDNSSPLYGHVRIGQAMDGTPCGSNKICVNKACEPLSTSKVTIDENEVKPLLTDGSWGSFGTWSSCSGGCGVSVMTARRPCNNPEPRHGAYCSGDEYKAKLCPTQKICSGESTVETTLVKQRADKICGEMASQFDFYPEGVRVKSSGVVDKCLLKCKQTNGKWSKDNFLYPDGTPCAGSDTSPYDDLLKGISRYCVKGQCMAFGCDGLTVGAGGGKVIPSGGTC